MRRDEYRHEFAISTHSRAKAAGQGHARGFGQCGISTHSRAKAAGWYTPQVARAIIHFNSQPREGGWQTGWRFACMRKNFNSQPREGGWLAGIAFHAGQALFQLTAARRRLDKHTHKLARASKFQLTAARRRLDTDSCSTPRQYLFQLTAARRRLAKQQSRMPEA